LSDKTFEEVVNRLEEIWYAGLKNDPNAELYDGKYYCKLCGDVRETVVEHSGNRVPRECKCMGEALKRKELDEAARQSYILREQRLKSYKIINATFENDDPTKSKPEILKRCKTYCENFQKIKCGTLNSIVFHGNCGTGKTFYSGCIANQLISNGYGVRWYDLPEAIELAKNFSTQLEFWNEIKHTACVFIDDFGVEQGTANDNKIIYQIINNCYKDNIPLVMTTNVNINAMIENESNLDITAQRILSRLQEMAIPIEIVGEDLRKRKAT
jgi:DNA replication protein